MLLVLAAHLLPACCYAYCELIAASIVSDIIVVLTFLLAGACVLHRSNPAALPDAVW